MTSLPSVRLLSALLVAALALPIAAHADDRTSCRHSQPRELALELDGVRTIRFEIGASRVRIEGAGTPDATLRGRACASSADLLQRLVLEQTRSGSTLTVSLRREASGGVGWFADNHAWLDLHGQVPAGALVQLVVGSGEARVTGVAAASADVGSGDAELRSIAGRATAQVGSGDVRVEDVGALKLLSIGSGDVEANQVHGPVEVGSVGSGDFRLHGARGDVRIDRLGSGDIDLRTVAGDVRVGSIGSGDLDIRDVAGDLTVGARGSGDIDHADVRGAVALPRH